MTKIRGFVDRKGHKRSNNRQSWGKTKHRPINRIEMKWKSESLSASARKLSSGEPVEVQIDASFGYRILNFVTVFSAISSVVKCKECNGEIKFRETSIRGLGFKLLIVCNSCNPTSVNSSPLINGYAYEINRRICFVFRLLGIGYTGIEKFCGLMDLPKPVVKTMYYKIMSNILEAVAAVAKKSLKNAANEEIKKNREAGNDPGLIVSGDGTWMKRGFSSLHGVSTLIGYYSGKVVDYMVKSAYCKACEMWEKYVSTVEYALWKEDHKEECSANHEGSSGKMEVDAIIEMFARSTDLHSAQYTKYVGDGDSKTYNGIVNSKPYGETIIEKKECICHVQKRMGSRLRNLKKQRKGLRGKGKLTNKLINELAVYYGLAIRRNLNSKGDMKNAIWATYLHKISTDKKPQHKHCSEEWCSYKQAKANKTLENYKHKDPLLKDVQEAIYPIYVDLTSDDLLKRCEGGYTQNNNESVNSVIWTIAPKTNFCGKDTVDIAAGVAISTFNDGYMNILQMLEILKTSIGPGANDYCNQMNKKRIHHAELRAQQSSKEARQLLKQARDKANRDFEDEEGSLYGPGLAD